MKYENLPNSLVELYRMKAALPEKQRAESQRIEQARADLKKEVESFKASVTMPKDPDKVSVGKIAFNIISIILAIACVLLSGGSFLLIVLGGITGFFAVFSIKAETSPASEEAKAEYQLACTDFEAYKEKKAKEFAAGKESALRGREFKLEAEGQLIDRKIAAVKAEIDSRAKHKPKCPTCGSERVAPIGEAERWMDSTGLGTVVGGGLNSPSLGKSYRCFNCGYRW